VILKALHFPLIIFSLLPSQVGECTYNSAWHTCWGFSDCVFSFHLNLLSVYMAAVFSGSGCAWQLSNVMSPWHEQIWILDTQGVRKQEKDSDRDTIFPWQDSTSSHAGRHLRKTIYWLASGKHIQILLTLNLYLTKHWFCIVKIKVLKTVPL